MPRVVITKGNEFRREVIFTDTDIIPVGWSETNTIVLPDPTLKVSRHHAAIVRAPSEREQYFIRDLGSLHSTKVEGAILGTFRQKSRSWKRLGKRRGDQKTWVK